MTNSSAIVQVVTWNDFGEGSMVEPTQEYGYRDLGSYRIVAGNTWNPIFHGNTNDLAMALRFYNLRRQYSTNSVVSE